MYDSSWGKVSQFAVVGNLTDRVALRHLSWGDVRDKWHPDISAKVQWDYNPKRDTELPTIRKIDRGWESDWKRQKIERRPTNWAIFGSQLQLPLSKMWRKTNKLPIALLTLVSIYIHVDHVYISHRNQGHDKRVMLPKDCLCNFGMWPHKDLIP